LSTGECAQKAIPIQVDQARGTSSKGVDEAKYPAQHEHERAGGALKARMRTDLIRCEHDDPLLAYSPVSRNQRGIFLQ
jgi:hypothetical protein